MAEEFYFEVRRWSLNYFQGPFEYYPENDEFLTLANAARYVIETVIPKAGEYGITSLELTGYRCFIRQAATRRSAAGRMSTILMQTA